MVAMVMVEAGVSEAVVIVEVVGGGGGFGHCLKIRKEEFGDLARSWGRMVAGTVAGGGGGGVIGVLMGVVMGSEGDGVPGKQSPAGAHRVTESKPE